MMKRWCLALALLVATAVPAWAQLQSGTIYGSVRDDQGGALPGANLSLTGPDRTMTFTTDADGLYRFVNLPPGRYRLRAELPGFSTYVREELQVAVGQNLEIPVSLRVASVQETVTVTSETPVVDTKVTGTGTNFTQDELSKIPTSRDPWALLRTVPGVQMDRVNIAGNETGQQSNFTSKGASRYDSVWTLDGVIITDMSATGGSPTYFDFDAFDEIQISTSGNDLKQPTGGVGLNFVVKRGTNQLRGTARGYFTNDALEASNVPDELLARGITPETADHNDQISDYGFDAGGPILRDKVWLWGSWTKQDIRLVRSAGNILDRTILKTTNLKGTWQATSKDSVSVLWFVGDKIKEGRGTNDAPVLAPTSTWNQGNLYPEGRPHGLLKVADDRVMSNSLFVSGKYAYYGTGFSLEPQGGLDGQASISTRLGQTFGTTRAQRFLRPQHTFNADASYFKEAFGGSHDVRFGGGYRRHDASSQVLWPGNMILALDNSATDTRARLYREGFGTNRNETIGFYAGDTFSRGRMTLDVGVRYDRQWGNALESNTTANREFPNVVPGVEFAGYRTPFTWNTLLPRVGATFALDESRKTLLRGNFSLYAGQMDASIVGWSNPSGNVGFVEYPWVDRNADNFVQGDEVVFTANPLSFGGGFNPAEPTAVRSSNVLDPGMKAPITTTAIVGIERELRANLALRVNYTYTRNVDAVQLSGSADPIGQEFIPWVGLTAADYLPGTTVTGTLPDGSAYSVPTFIPDPARVAANSNQRLLTNYSDFYVDYHGLEVSLVKRLSNRWMMRGGFAWNNPTEHFDGTPVNFMGNPTPTESSPLVEGGQNAPRSTGSGTGDVFINGQWQISVNGVYQLPWSMEVAASVFGRQGNPMPLFQSVALGLDGSQRVLVTPAVDTFRYDDIWNTDIRVAKHVRTGRFSVELNADVFNLFNGNVELNRQRNVVNPAFGQLTQNLSPRILRFGMRLGF